MIRKVRAAGRRHVNPLTHGSVALDAIDIRAPLRQPDLDRARERGQLAGALGMRFRRSFGDAPMRAMDIEENLLRMGEQPGSATMFEMLIQAEDVPGDELANWSALTLGSFHRFLGVTSIEASAAASALDNFERTQLILGIANTLGHLSNAVTPEDAAAMMATMRSWGMPVVDILKSGEYVLAEEEEEAVAV